MVSYGVVCITGTEALMATVPKMAATVVHCT
jgi:hypothetical protein